MARHFALTVRLYDRRYHGAHEWPPAPARVFQALVAGAAEGRRVPADAAHALALLERLGAPIIAAPAARLGQKVVTYVPNNDLDAVGGAPERVDELRVKKTICPRLLESDAPFLYAWPLADADGHELTDLARGLYQFGRGVDPAWAVGETLDDEELAARLRAHRGTVHLPAPGEGSNELAVPTASSFGSIVRRFDAALVRLRPSADGQSTDFVQPPKAHFDMVRYDGMPAWHLFELRNESEPAKASPWLTSRATSLIEHVRDLAVAALSRAFPTRTADIERVLVGRRSDGTNSGPIAERVRFVPLPSIGHPHADQSIRRVIVQVPRGPLAESDVLWALSGRVLFDSQTGELGNTTLAEVPTDEMVTRYCATSRTWRSVTPVALGSAKRRRIEPARQHDESKSATERRAEEQRARSAVDQALRHAGIAASLIQAHVQREPFDARGTRVEHFAAGTRFPKESLWHVEIGFDRKVRGPLVLGDGRFLGLGVMAPRIERRAFVLDVEGGLPVDADVTTLARALRRAVLARVQAILADAELPPYFHGHGDQRHHQSTHLAFSVDAPRSRLLIVPPHVLDGRQAAFREESHLETLDRALSEFTTLRAGAAGVLSLRAAPISSADPLVCVSKMFRSITDYVVSRHAKRSSAEATVALDVRRECGRRKLPMPNVQVTNVRGVPCIGVVARVDLTFEVAVRGPLLLGKTRYLGGGLFAPI